MDRELNRGLIRPPKETYKELWTLRQKLSNGKIQRNPIGTGQKIEFLDGTFGVGQRKYVMCR
jgi:hypothetical protein